VFAARGADLLIHEATFGDACAEDARIKTHSTTHQAMDVFEKAGAKFMLLTHLSSRYPRFVDYSDRLMDAKNVGLAYDNLVVSLTGLIVCSHNVFADGEVRGEILVFCQLWLSTKQHRWVCINTPPRSEGSVSILPLVVRGFINTPPRSEGSVSILPLVVRGLYQYSLS